MFRVKDVMTEEVIACRADDPLDSAVRAMRDRGCGCIPVLDASKRVVGLVTMRDAVMCALREMKPLFDLRVSEACTRGVVCCDSDDTLDRAETLMRVNQVRRLPVVDAEGVLVGLRARCRGRPRGGRLL